MNLSSKRKSVSYDQRQLLQDKIKYLHQSSSHFINFIEKFCDNNSSHLYHGRSGFSACYHQLMDYLNMHLSHLRQIFAFYVDINSDGDTLCLLFASTIDDILKTSKDKKILTYAEHQKIDIFLCLTNFLKGTQFDDQQRTVLLDKLKYLSVHGKNNIASILYKKLQALL